MQSEVWYSSIARVIAIVVAVGLYVVALVAFFRKTKRPAQMPVTDKMPAEVSYVGPERRIHPRARVDISVRYKPHGIKGVLHVFKEARIKDISEGGFLLVEGQEKLEVNSVMEFKFRLPSMAHFILLRGDVVWVRDLEQGQWYNYGISITAIDPNDRKQIAKYVASQHIVGSDFMNIEPEQKKD
jgi:c-di-GMP-binding flagellar brake protein YcgR